MSFAGRTFKRKPHIVTKKKKSVKKMKTLRKPFKQKLKTNVNVISLDLKILAKWVTFEFIIRALGRAEF